MKIGIIADPVDRQQAGVHVYTRELITHLLRLDDQNEYILIRSRQDGRFSQAKNIVLPIYSIPGYASYRLFIKIPIVMRREGVDVVIEPAHFGPFNLPDSIKRVTVIHDITPLKMPKFHTLAGQGLQRLFLPGILRRSDQIITNSEYTRSDVIERFPFTSSKIEAVHLGKDAAFKPVIDSKVPAKYGIEGPYFLFVGTIEPRKDLTTLLAAYSYVRDKTHLKWKLVIAGMKGWKTDAFYKALASHSYKDDIVLPGYVEKEDLPALYSMAGIFIYPSLYEGFGLPVLEAMACGTACIVSNSSSLPEVAGPRAAYFEPGNAKALADQMIRLASHEEERNQMATALLERAHNFTWENTARHTRNILNRLINR